MAELAYARIMMAIEAHILLMKILSLVSAMPRQVMTVARIVRVLSCSSNMLREVDLGV